MAMFLKDRDARLDYRMDWTACVGAGVSIETSTWLVEPAGEPGVTLEDGGFDGLVATCWVAGGEAGHGYRVTNRVLLSNGVTDERTILVRVEDH